MDEQGPDAAPATGSESDADLTRRLVGFVKARDVRLTGSAAGLVAAAGNLSIQNGGTQAMFVAGRARIGRNGFVGVVASPNVTIEDGARVLLDSPKAIAVGAGVGLGVALLARLMRR